MGIKASTKAIAAQGWKMPIRRSRLRSRLICSGNRSASCGDMLSRITSLWDLRMRLASTVQRLPNFTIISGMAGKNTPTIKISCCIRPSAMLPYHSAWRQGVSLLSDAIPIMDTVDHILHRQAGKDDSGDPRKDHRDALVNPCFGHHGGAQNDPGCEHHRNQRGIGCDHTTDAAGEIGGDNDH